MPGPDTLDGLFFLLELSLERDFLWLCIFTYELFSPLVVFETFESCPTPFDKLFYRSFLLFVLVVLFTVYDLKIVGLLDICILLRAKLFS